MSSILDVDNVMAETDNPHSDSSWQDSIELMPKQLAHLPMKDQMKISRSNAEHLFYLQADSIPGA
jgi:hypothetical protein